MAMTLELPNTSYFMDSPIIINNAASGFKNPFSEEIQQFIPSRNVLIKRENIINFSLIQERIDFANFIQDRIVYIDSLTKLPTNWINGYSIKPDLKVISNSKSVLNYIKDFILENDLLNNVNIIMSPTPEGDFSIQVKHFLDYQILTIKQNLVEIEMYKKDYFSDLNDILIDHLEDITYNLDLLVDV